MKVTYYGLLNTLLYFSVVHNIIFLGLSGDMQNSISQGFLLTIILTYIGEEVLKKGNYQKPKKLAFESRPPTLTADWTATVYAWPYELKIKILKAIFFVLEISVATGDGREEMVRPEQIYGTDGSGVVVVQLEEIYDNEY